MKQHKKKRKEKSDRDISTGGRVGGVPPLAQPEFIGAGELGGYSFKTAWHFIPVYGGGSQGHAEPELLQGAELHSHGVKRLCISEVSECLGAMSHSSPNDRKIA